MVAQEEPKREMSQYAKEQISVHSAMVTYISMTALITLCPAFVLFLYATAPWLPLSPSMLLATSPNAWSRVWDAMLVLKALVLLRLLSRILI